MTDITVIIPTACTSARADSLRRAIDSIVGQKGVSVKPLVIINGQQYSPDIYQSLINNPKVDVKYISEPSAPAAQRHGRSLVLSKYFSFLDDDDEYLPGTLLQRMNILEKNPGLDFVCTNGYKYNTENELLIDKEPNLHDNPVLTILSQNWLPSAGGLFRSDSVGLEYFDCRVNYFEWTHLAFRLLLDNRKARFLNTPGYRIHVTPNSLSQSEGYIESYIDFLRILKQYHVNGTVRRKLEQKITRAHHELSDYYMKKGNLKLAWQHHVSSLFRKGGFRYLPYSRYLLMPGKQDV